MLWLPILISATLLAQNPIDSSADRAKIVRQLVRQLDADSLALRTEAEQKLVEMGSAALPHLVPLETTQLDMQLSAEARRRLRNIKNQIRSQQVTHFVKESTVDLRGEMTLDDALAQLGRMTGNQVKATTGGASRVDLDLTSVTFWDALIAIMQQSKQEIDTSRSRDHQIFLIPKNPDLNLTTPYYVTSGPLLIRVERLLRQARDERLGLDFAHVSSRIFWEPRLTPISIRLRSASIQGKLNDQPIAKPLNPKAVADATVRPGASYVDVAFTLQSKDDISKLNRLAGEIEFVVAGPNTTFEFRPVGKPTRPIENKGLVTASFQKLEWRNQQATIDVDLTYQLGAENSALESHSMWVIRHDAALVDPHGKQVPAFRAQHQSQGKNEFGVTFFFHSLPNVDDWTFRLTTPGGIVSSKQAFEIVGIDLQ